MSRKFYLQNKNGIIFDLNDIDNSAFFSDPDGLGYDNGVSYIRIGNRYHEKDRDLKQGIFNGILIFLDYGKYKEFVDFVESAGSLVLIYEPEDKKYYRDIDFASIGKGEKSGAWLKCNAKINCKSLYYISVEKSFAIGTVTDEKRYDYIAESVYNDDINTQIEFDNVGQVDAEIEIELNGYAENISLELYDKSVQVLYEDEYKIFAYQEGTELAQYCSKAGVVDIVKVDGASEVLHSEGDISPDNPMIVNVPESTYIVSGDGASSNQIFIGTLMDIENIGTDSIVRQSNGKYIKTLNVNRITLNAYQQSNWFASTYTTSDSTCISFMQTFYGVQSIDSIATYVSNRFKPVAFVNMNITEGEFMTMKTVGITGSVSRIIITIKKSRLTTLDAAGFIAWATENPLQFFCKDIKPMVSEIEGGISLTTYPGTTTISISSDIKPKIYTEFRQLETYVREVPIETLEKSMTFDTAIQEGEKLLYSVRDGDSYLEIQDVNGVRTNAIDCVDINADNFFKISVGKKVIKIVGTFTSAKAKLFTYFKGV